MSSPARPTRIASIGLAAIAAVAATRSAVAGGPPDVAIVAAAQATSTSPWFTDPQAKLVASGLFGVVDIINASNSTPTLASK